MATNDAVQSAENTSNHSMPPEHVAIIMDGNGRWATSRGLPRVQGHRKGLETLRTIVRHAGNRKIKYLTLYSFSSENWQRPTNEVSFLLDLLKRFVHNDLAELHSANVRVNILGDRNNLSKEILKLLDYSENLTRKNSGMQLNVAFNYGARNEITRGIRKIANEVLQGKLSPAGINEQKFSALLDTGEIPDPDVIIRTSGEQRLSNFLLWQAAYSELVFREEYWPDFTPAAFDEAIEDFQCRERRFGGLKETVSG